MPDYILKSHFNCKVPIYQHTFIEVIINARKIFFKLCTRIHTSDGKFCRGLKLIIVAGAVDIGLSPSGLTIFSTTFKSLAIG